MAVEINRDGCVAASWRDPASAAASKLSIWSFSKQSAAFHSFRCEQVSSYLRNRGYVLSFASVAHRDILFVQTCGTSQVPAATWVTARL